MFSKSLLYPTSPFLVIVLLYFRYKHPPLKAVMLILDDPLAQEFFPKFEQIKKMELGTTNIDSYQML